MQGRRKTEEKLESMYDNVLVRLSETCVLFISSVSSMTAVVTKCSSEAETCAASENAAAATTTTQTNALV